MDQSSADKSVEIWTPYSHKDERMRDELGNHLANLKRQGSDYRRGTTVRSVPEMNGRKKLICIWIPPA